MRFSQLCFGILCLLVQIRYGVRCEVHILEDLDESEAFLKEQGGNLVVVLFTAVWCGPCKQIGPHFEELSIREENANVIFAAVDVDDSEDFAGKHNIQTMPTFVFFKEANEIDRFSGANQDLLEEKINEHR